MERLPQVYVLRLHPGVLAVKAAGMKLQKCENRESPLLLSAPNGYITSSLTQEHTKAIPISCRSDSMGHSNTQPGCFQSGQIPCAAKRGNQKTEKEVGAPSIWAASTHSSFHAISSSAKQLRPAGTALWDTKEMVLSPVLINGPDGQGWSPKHFLMLQLLFCYQSFCFTGQQLGHAHTSPFLVLSVYPALMRTARLTSHQSGLHPATSSSHMPVSAVTVDLLNSSAGCSALHKVQT